MAALDHFIADNAKEEAPMSTFRLIALWLEAAGPA
jgi:hypothetical protein